MENNHSTVPCDSVQVDHDNFVRIKDQRKRTEEDAQLLSNRIALLKQEEAKTLKKIEETRKRAGEILETRMRNLEIQRKKEEQRRLKEAEISRKTEEKRLEMEAARAAREASKRDVAKKV